MGFELVSGMSPVDPAPIALCDNPGCDVPIMTTGGWAISSYSPHDDPAPGYQRRPKILLACSTACLAIVRNLLDGHCCAPIPYKDYWQAVGPMKIEKPPPKINSKPKPVISESESDSGNESVGLRCSKKGWLRLAIALHQAGNEDLANFIRAGLAFGCDPNQSALDQEISFSLDMVWAAAIVEIAGSLGISFSYDGGSVDLAVQAAVAEAEAIIRAHQTRHLR